VICKEIQQCPEKISAPNLNSKAGTDMKTRTQVAVIGGGIAGCSTLYHLTQEGISDCVLIERDELTSGTTWHSAAQVTNFGPNQTMVGLKTHSINLYKDLADDPDYPINYHHGTGGIRLASTQDHLDGYHHFASMAKGMGVEFEVIDAAECAQRHPLITTDTLLGALWDPMDGDIDPAQLCQALARRARKAGAEVYRHTPVTGLQQLSDETWVIETAKGKIEADMIVNAGGYRCNEIGAMMDVVHPVASMEHQYMVTETIPQIAALDGRVPLIRCPTDDFYQRQEKNGLLIGFYEQGCKTWGLDGIDPNFSNDLCPDDFDRVIDVMEGAIKRLPCLESAGIASIINGPITYTPDGLPLVGPIPGRRNAYCITGLRAGLGEGGGHGWLLAQIIAHGEACYDTWCLDPRRFTAYASVEYTAKKAIEDYQNEFRFHMPHEHRPAGRPAKTSPVTERLAELGAEFGTINGWERAEYFHPKPGFAPTLSFRFGNIDLTVEAEVRNVQTRVGIMEVCGFTRFALRGEAVHDWLDRVMCSKINRTDGRVGLSYFLNQHGMVKGEATLANMPDGSVWYGAAAAAQSHDFDWLMSHDPAAHGIEIEDLTDSHTTLVIAGPDSAKLLAKICPDIAWEGFGWLNVKPIEIAGSAAFAMSVSFSGELAWELHIPNAQVAAAYDLIMEAGEAFKIRPFGTLAAEAMRIEKGYRHWKADLITEFSPFAADLTRFVDQSKDFFGKDALMALGEEAQAFVTLEIDDDTAPARPGDSILHDGKVVGTVTSASFGHRTQKNLAMAYLDKAHCAPGISLKLLRLGKPVAAAVISSGPYDPKNERIAGYRAKA
jgi:dimethylglycine dehydrogenase